MIIYIENIPINFENSVEGDLISIRHSFKPIILTTSSKNIDKVRNWYYDYTNRTPSKKFNIYYPNTYDSILANCHPTNWCYNSRRGLIEIELEFSYYQYIPKHWKLDSSQKLRKEKLMNIECLKST